MQTPSLKPHRLAFAVRLGLLTAAMGGLAVALPAYAQTVEASYRFDIAAGPLSTALTQIALKTGVNLTADAALTNGKKAPALKGNLTLRQALNQLLAGTGLHAVALGNGYVLHNVPAVVPAAKADDVLPEVAVQAKIEKENAYGPVKGYVAKRSATASKTDTAVTEAPQSISIVTRDEMNARNVQTLTEAVAYTPGVRVGAFGFDPRFDSFSLRGFDVTYTGIYKDGLRQLSSNFALYKEEPYSAERIDILKGPSSVLYGQSEPSGLINIVTKRPQFETRHQADVQLGNYDRQQLRFDTTGAMNEDNTVAYRLTGVYRDSDSPVNGGHDDRVYIAPALTWQPNDKTTLTILTHYEKDKTVGNSSYFNDGTGHVDKDLPSGDPAFQNFTQEQYQIGYLFEHLLNEHWTLRQNARTGRINMNARYTQIDSVAGNVATRSTGQLVERLHSYAIDNQAQWQGDTGSLNHTAVFGLDWTRSINNGKMGFGAAPDLDLTTLNYGAQAIDSPALDQPYEYRLNQIGAYAQDQIKWDQWILTIGGRHDWAATAQETTTDNDDRSFKRFSGRVGLGYQLANGITPYISYATSFVPLLGRNASGGFFKPTTGTQIEAGIKYQPDDINLMVTASVFQITKENIVVTTGPASQRQVGEVRSRGFEVEAKASLDSGVNLTAAYTFLMPKFNGRQDDNYDNLQSGQPKNNVALWADYTLPSGMLQGLGVGGGVRHLGTSYGDDANTYSNRRVTLFDMTAHYAIDQHWRFALNANNLADNRYSICTQAYCYVAQPRTVIGTLSYTW